MAARGYLKGPLLLFALGWSVCVMPSCGSGGGGQTQEPISVSVTAEASTVEAGGKVSVVAQVSNDSSNKGVTWTVSCSSSPCGSVQPTTTASGTATTYTAPANSPLTGQQVTVTAASVSDPSASGSATLDFVAIAVSLTATASPVGAGGTTQITAAVMNDPANKGVNPASWAISPATGAGTLSNPTSSSVVYTAPAAPPAADVQVTITASSASSPKNTGTITITFAAIAVSLSPSASSLAAQGTATITAMVSFDPANAGVSPASWTISSPASGGGALSNPTSSSVTYTAPATPPTNNLSVTITATSMTDSTKSGSTSVTVLAITVTVSPGSALIPINITQQFGATVQNDPTNQGVNWTTSQAGTSCTSGCGALAPTGTASGAATTYTAPAAVPTNAKVTLIATSATDATKSAAATVTVSAGTVKIVPNSLNFATLKSSQTGSMTTTVTNTATTTLTISNVTITGTGAVAFSLGTNGCGSSVTAGSSCNLAVTFKPEESGTFNAVLSISDSSSDSPQEISLTGKGVRERAPDLASAIALNKVRTVPRPTGSSAVGTRVLRLVDSTREDPFLANGTKRELLVRLWYPAEDGESCTRAEYAPAQVWRYFSQLLELPLPQVTTNSCWNTTVADGGHPIVVFTPGFTATFTDYSFLFEDLASRGYVVVSVDHPFEATAVEFPDGRFVTSVFGSHLTSIVRGDEEAMNVAVSVRLSDLQFVVNELEQMSTAGSGPFAGKLDVSRLALAGHSLGGLTTIRGVEEDPRFRAGIVLDGAMPHSVRETETPVLMLATGRDEWSEEERQLWNALHGPRLAVNLRGTEHLTGTDAVWLAAGTVKTGTMGPEKTMAAIRDFIAAFLDANLLGKAPDALLTGASTEYPDATVTTQTQLLHAKN